MKLLIACTLVAFGVPAMAVELPLTDPHKEDIRLLVVPDDQELFDSIAKHGVIEVDRGTLERIHLAGQGITYYIFDRERALRSRVKNSLTSLGKHDADIVIWPGHLFSEAIHLRVLGSNLTTVTHLRFDRGFLITQTNEIAIQGEFPSDDARIEYSEYAYDSDNCPGLASSASQIPSILANSLNDVGQRPPTGTMRHLQVDGASFAVHMRTEFTAVNFSVGTNSGPLWDAVRSVVDRVRNCSELHSPVVRSY
ncbi:MAG: hypothetical protein HKN15_13360 [Xanthomonadales bacterium]|nr:hypothetical protein [Xanthomonadales bacterium]